MKMKIEDIKPNPNNPRTIKDDNFKKLVQSIKEFPEMLEAREIVLNKDHIILGGNMRYRAAKEAGIKELPVKIVDWSEEKQKEFIIKDNVSGGDWDYDVLANEWNVIELEKWGLEVPLPSDDNYYTRAVNAPVYEPKKDVQPELNELVDTTKTDKLIEEIEKTNLNDDLKQFLKLASYRHLKFDYSIIAEYYAHSDDRVKDLFEKSALVIIDFNKAIENGFVELTKLITEIQKEDYNEE